MSSALDKSVASLIETEYIRQTLYTDQSNMGASTRNTCRLYSVIIAPLV